MFARHTRTRIRAQAYPYFRRLLHARTALIVDCPASSCMWGLGSTPWRNVRVRFCRKALGVYSSAMASGSHKAIIAAFAANLGIAVSKFVGFLVTGASSMLAEAVHSAADSGNQGLLLLGVARAQQPESAERPFGHGRERYFWAFVVALVLFMLGGVFAIYEGIHKWLHPEPLDSTYIAVLILVVGITLEGWSLRTALKEAGASRGNLGWIAYYRRTKAAELPVILLEDLGALVGLMIALCGIGVATLTGDPRFDALASIAIGVLLTLIAVALSLKMRSLLVGEAAGSQHLRAIRETLEGSPYIRRVLHMRTTHLGPDALLIGAKVEFQVELSFAEIAAAINAVECEVRRIVPIARYIYIEPDVPQDSIPVAVSGQ